MVVFAGDEVPREPIPDDLRKAARASMLHCQSLVENVMDFTKFKANKMELESVEFSLRAVCKEVMQTMCHAFPAVPQTLSCARRYRVKGSRRHLKQVLQNLVSNACKNTGPSGFVELEVELLAQTEPGRSAYRFAVRDTGCGVPREKQAQIFRPVPRSAETDLRHHLQFILHEIADLLTPSAFLLLSCRPMSASTSRWASSRAPAWACPWSRASSTSWAATCA